MRRLLLFCALLLFVLPAAAQTVYVPYGAKRTPRIEWKGRTVKPRRMRGDTLCAEGVRFVRLPRLQLFLCIGQSNMAGRGPMDAAARDTLGGVYLFNAEGRFERAVEPMNRYSTVRKELGMQRVGPVGGFAARYAEVTGAAVGAVVNARGGSAIGEWLPGSEQSYLDEALRRMREAREWGDVKAVLWHQGEADARHPERYEAQLRRLINVIRTELGDPTLPIVFGEISRWNWTGRPEGTEPFNAMLRALRIPRTACVSSEGLAPMKDDTDPHFSAPSQRELGRRYAESLLKLLENQKPE